MARPGPLNVGDVVQLRSQRQVRADAQHLPVCTPPGTQQPVQAVTRKGSMCNAGTRQPSGYGTRRAWCVKRAHYAALAAVHCCSFIPTVVADVRSWACAHDSWHQPAHHRCSKAVVAQQANGAHQARPRRSWRRRPARARGARCPPPAASRPFPRRPEGRCRPECTGHQCQHVGHTVAPASAPKERKVTALHTGRVHRLQA